MQWYIQGGDKELVPRVINARAKTTPSYLACRETSSECIKNSCRVLLMPDQRRLLYLPCSDTSSEGIQKLVACVINARAKTTTHLPCRETSSEWIKTESAPPWTMAARTAAASQNINSGSCRILGELISGLWIRIHFLRIRTQFFLKADPDPVIKDFVQNCLMKRFLYSWKRQTECSTVKKPWWWPKFTFKIKIENVSPDTQPFKPVLWDSWIFELSCHP